MLCCVFLGPSSLTHSLSPATPLALLSLLYVINTSFVSYRLGRFLTCCLSVCLSVGYVVCVRACECLFGCAAGLSYTHQFSSFQLSSANTCMYFHSLCPTSRPSVCLGTYAMHPPTDPNMQSRTHPMHVMYVPISPTDRSTVSTQRFAYFRSVDRWIGPSHSPIHPSVNHLSTFLLTYLPGKTDIPNMHHAHTHTHTHTSAQSRPTGVRNTQYEGMD